LVWQRELIVDSVRVFAPGIRPVAERRSLSNDHFVGRTSGDFGGNFSRGLHRAFNLVSHNALAGVLNSG
jgi:hypothetical protein